MKMCVENKTLLCLIHVNQLTAINIPFDSNVKCS